MRKRLRSRGGRAKSWRPKRSGTAPHTEHRKELNASIRGVTRLLIVYMETSTPRVGTRRQWTHIGQERARSAFKTCLATGGNGRRHSSARCQVLRRFRSTRATRPPFLTASIL